MRAAEILSRRRQRRMAMAQQTAYRVTTPAPISGWNTRDGANEVSSNEFYEGQNLIPTVGGLVLRPGYGSYLEGDTNAITSLMVWASGTEEKLLYATGTTLQEVGGTATTGLSSGNWVGQMMNDRLGMVNGSDAPKYFNGLEIQDLPITGPAEPNRFIGLKVFKSRSYFWADQLEFWYSAPNALGGILTKFPLNTVAQRGGRVLSINAWTQDGGAGPDDFLVVTTTKGEVIVYAGSNPSDANDWALVGRYYISEPVSSKCFLELDGKLLVLTKNDLETLPDRFTRQSQPPTKISKAIREAYDKKPSSDLWQLVFDAKRQLVILNVPARRDRIEQYVLAARGATRFTGIPAQSWAMFRGELYWAGRGKESNYLMASTVDFLSWSLSPMDLLSWQGGELTTNHHIWRMGGSRDNGDFIYFDARTGYSPLRGNGQKRVAMYRPLFVCQGRVIVSTSLSYDYGTNYSGEQAISQEAEDSTDWGSEWNSDWQTINQERGQWFVGQGSGQMVSLRCQGLALSPLQWAQTDWELIGGGKY